MVPPNHFSPDYFKNQEWHLADLSQSEKYYRIARSTYENAGRTIIDATLNGRLQIFDKVHYTDVFLNLTQEEEKLLRSKPQEDESAGGAEDE